MQRKVILYIISSLSNSGPVNFLYNLLVNIDREEYKLVIITLSREPKDSRILDFEKLGDVYSLNLSRFMFYIKGLKRLKALINSIKPSIIHTSGIRADIFISHYKMKTPNISTIHSLIEEDYYKTYGRYLGFLLTKLHIRAIRRLKQPVACSLSVSQKYKAKYNIAMKYVQNGVDSNVFKPSLSEKKNKLKAKLSLYSFDRIFIYIGNLDKRKDPITVLRAFRESKVEGAALVILGDGILLESLKQYESSNIFFMGKVKCVNEFLDCADVFISASKSEGLPLAVLEAINSGLAVILSDIPSHREIYALDSSMGALFPVCDVYTLKYYIRKLNNEDLKSYKIAARSIGANYFNAKNMALNYERLYREILGEREV